jgi:hypothetical protein
MGRASQQKWLALRRFVLVTFCAIRFEAFSESYPSFEIQLPGESNEARQEWRKEYQGNARTIDCGPQ